MSPGWRVVVEEGWCYPEVASKLRLRRVGVALASLGVRD